MDSDTIISKKRLLRPSSCQMKLRDGCWDDGDGHLFGWDRCVGHRASYRPPVIGQYERRPERFSSRGFYVDFYVSFDEVP